MEIIQSPFLHGLSISALRLLILLIRLCEGGLHVPTELLEALTRLPEGLHSRQLP